MEQNDFMFFEDLPYQTQELLLDLIVSILKNEPEPEEAEESEELQDE
jgi:hypothetical protein